MQEYQQVFKFECGPFNWFLIEEDSRFTLVDAGFPSHYAILKQGLKEMGKSINDLEAIVITHAHADHTGFAAVLSRDANIPVYMHCDDVRAASRVLQLPWYGLLSNAWRPYIRKMLLHATLNGVFTMPVLPKVEPVTHEQFLEVPGRPQIIHLPGHTAGQIALFLPDRQILVSGDSLVTRNLLTGADGIPQLPQRMLNDDHRQAIVSLQRFKGLGQLTMLPGHGNAWEGDLESVIATELDQLS